MKKTVADWYQHLGFRSCYDKEFKEALSEIRLSDAITVESYDKSCKNGRRNLLSYLFFAEKLKEQYAEKGISEEILLDTLSDLPIWLESWSNVKGELYLGELEWLARHLQMKLFRLGRLQFCMAASEFDIPSHGIKKGDNVIEIHIPEGKKLTVADCMDSIDRAKEFFKTYFPAFNYTCFTCHSWLLDDSLRSYLSKESGILAFADLFERVAQDDSNAIIRYLFRWDTTEANLRYALPSSRFAERIKNAVLAGAQFHETLGVIKA